MLQVVCISPLAFMNDHLENVGNLNHLPIKKSIDLESMDFYLLVSTIENFDQTTTVSLIFCRKWSPVALVNSLTCFSAFFKSSYSNTATLLRF